MSHPNSSSMPPPSRKVFNTFIDDGALISGVKRSTRDGIKRMLKEGSINLFVPLHTLERLNRLRERNDRLSRDAADTLRWLDDITSTSETRVHLQGGFELYEKWEDVEQFLLPETLLSMDTESLSADSIADDLADVHLDSSDKASMSSSGSIEQRSSKSSPISAYSAPSPAIKGASQYQKEKVLAPIGTGRPSHKKTASELSASSSFTAKSKEDRIPKSLQPFFNHILWRIHHEQNADPSSFILVTNDSLKQSIAQRFGIRAKTLEQLRKIVSREYKEYKSHLAYQQKEEAATPANPLRTNKPVDTPHQDVHSDKAANSDDEDEVVFKREPPKAPQAMAAGRKVFDPDQFGRPAGPIANGNNDHRGNSFPHAPAHFNRGGRGGRGGFRGRGHFRGNFALAHKPTQNAGQQAPVDLNAPIDPDSFSRPAPNGRLGGRGGRRRLWEPS